MSFNHIAFFQKLCKICKQILRLQFIFDSSRKKCFNVFKILKLPFDQRHTQEKWATWKLDWSFFKYPNFSFEKFISSITCINTIQVNFKGTFWKGNSKKQSIWYSKAQNQILIVPKLSTLCLKVPTLFQMFWNTLAALQMSRFWSNN